MSFKQSARELLKKQRYCLPVNSIIGACSPLVRNTYPFPGPSAALVPQCSAIGAALIKAGMKTYRLYKSSILLASYNRDCGVIVKVRAGFLPFDDNLGGGAETVRRLSLYGGHHGWWNSS
jgi:hypothetical protein